MRTLAIIAVAAGISLAASASRFAQSANAAPAAPATPVKSGYAPVDGLQLYYEYDGTGKPLVLLHGGLGAIEMFGPVLTAFAASRQVIAVDLQGHGRTADIDRPLRYELMADDIAGLIKYLGLGKAGRHGVFARRRRSASGRDSPPGDGQKAHRRVSVIQAGRVVSEILAGEAQMGAATAEQMKQSPMYQLYAHLAPRPQDWPIFLTKISDMLSRDYDWTDGVKAIKAPTLLVFADQDAVQIGNMAEFFKLFGGGLHAPSWDGSGAPKAELAILPGVTHDDIFMSPALVSTVTPFLDAGQ